MLIKRCDDGSEFPVKLFVDTAEEALIHNLKKLNMIAGVTTNPTLMKKAGIVDYERAARKLIDTAAGLPISIEVIGDDSKSMISQGLKVGRWNYTVYVKIPIVNSKGESSVNVIRALTDEGVKLNITAVYDTPLIEEVLPYLNPKVPNIISVFAGRMADVGIDPEPIVKSHAELIKAHNSNAELLWASTRELYNMFQAQRCGCHIITMPPEHFRKLHKIGKASLDDLMLETAQTFVQDATAAEFLL